MTFAVLEIKHKVWHSAFLLTDWSPASTLFHIFFKRKSHACQCLYTLALDGPWLGASAETSVSILPFLGSFRCPWCLPGTPAPLASECSLPHHSSVIFLPKASIRTNVLAFVSDGCFQYPTRILNVSQRLFLEAHLRVGAGCSQKHMQDRSHCFPWGYGAEPGDDCENTCTTLIS